MISATTKALRLSALYRRPGLKRKQSGKLLLRCEYFALQTKFMRLHRPVVRHLCPEEYWVGKNNKVASLGKSCKIEKLSLSETIPNTKCKWLYFNLFNCFISSFMPGTLWEISATMRGFLDRICQRPFKPVFFSTFFIPLARISSEREYQNV